jgi:hypothetical protein
MLTAAERRVRNLSGIELYLVTHESTPSRCSGQAAAQLAGARLAEADVTLRTSCRVVGFEGGELRIEGTDPLAADAVVALPALRPVLAVPSAD